MTTPALDIATLDARLATLTPDQRQRVDALLRYPATFRTFVQRAFPRYEWHRPHEQLAAALEQVARGQIRRLMVFMPPQEGKSLQTTRLFPAYYLSQHPDRWVGLGSYSFGLAKGFSRDARAFYAAVMHEAQGSDTLADDAAAVDEWKTERGGGLWAVGRGGSATGKSAHLLIVDDPLKDRAEADSDTVRQSANDWYKSVLNMRLQPEPHNAVVVIMTRWHEADLAGHLLALEQEGDWRERWMVLDLPGIAERPEERPQYPKSVTVLPDLRTPGEPLGGRYPGERYAQVRAISGTREFDAQIQQRPSAAGGTIFRREWWQFYRERPRHFDRVVLSLDAAFKGSDTADFVALHAYGRVGPKVYLLERETERRTFTETLVSCRDMLHRWPKAVLYVEDKANGSAIVDSLQHEIGRVVAVNPEGGKVARAYACQGDVERGRVWLPEVERDGAFVRQASSFPTAPHDDDVDAFTQAMAVLRGELRDAVQREVEVAREQTWEGFDPSVKLKLKPGMKTPEFVGPEAEMDQWTGGYAGQVGNLY